MRISNEQLIHNRRIPLVLSLLISVIAIWYVVMIVMQWSLPKPQQTVYVAIHIPHVPQVELTHVYGKFVESLDSLPETQLQVTLQGVIIMTGTSNKNAAIISSPDKPAKLYHIGDIIPGDAELKKVMMTQVVIVNQGELQRLSLPIKSLATYSGVRS